MLYEVITGLERSRPEFLVSLREQTLAPVVRKIGAVAGRIVSEHPVVVQAAALAAVNALVCRELFFSEYLDRMGSRNNFV